MTNSKPKSKFKSSKLKAKIKAIEEEEEDESESDSSAIVVPEKKKRKIMTDLADVTEKRNGQDRMKEKSGKADKADRYSDEEEVARQIKKYIRESIKAGISEKGEGVDKGNANLNAIPEEEESGTEAREEEETGEESEVERMTVDGDGDEGELPRAKDKVRAKNKTKLLNVRPPSLVTFPPSLYPADPHISFGCVLILHFTSDIFRSLTRIRTTTTMCNRSHLWEKVETKEKRGQRLTSQYVPFRLLFCAWLQPSDPFMSTSLPPSHSIYCSPSPSLSPKGKGINDLLPLLFS